MKKLFSLGGYPLLVFLSVLTLSVSAQEAVITTADGMHVSGDISFKLENQRLLADFSSNGRRFSLNAEDLGDIVFRSWSLPEKPGPLMVEAVLLNGDSVIGSVAETAMAKDGDIEKEALVLESASLGKISVFWEKIRELRYLANRDYWPRRTMARQEDLILTKTGDERKGVLKRVSKEGIVYESKILDREVTLAPEDCAVIYFMEMSKAPEPPQSLYARLRMADGSRIEGLVLAASGDTLRVKSIAGLEFKTSLKQAAEIQFRNSRVAYLSDMTPLERDENIEPELAEKGITRFPTPFKADSNVQGKPLSLDGKTYRKGLGVHARSAIAFPLEGKYQKLEGVIGLDDCAKELKCGNVRFQVYAEGDIAPGAVKNGNKIFDSGPMSWKDNAKPLSVPVQGVKKLVLVVDYEDGQSTGDIADWAQIRVIRSK